MTIENDPSARIQVRSRGELRHPGSCCICGNGTCDDGYVDLGVFYDYEGTMYICMTCVFQIVAAVGCFTPEEVKMLNEQASEYARKFDESQTELAHAQHHIDTVNALLRSKFLPGSPVIVPGVEVSDESTPEQPADAEPVSEPPKGGTTRKSVIKEPTPFS